jgi:hypothetical protein
LKLPSGATGYGFINKKFDAVDGFGPTCIKNFVQQDAFGQVDAWLRAMGLRV